MKTPLSSAQGWMFEMRRVVIVRGEDRRLLAPLSSFLLGSVISLCCAMAQTAGPTSAVSFPEGAAPIIRGQQVMGPNRPPLGRLIVLGFSGDLGFSGKDQPLTTSGAIRHGQVIPWAALTSGLDALLRTDATFANLETVVTDRTDLVAADRSFNFAASPQGIFALARAGVNVLATANNHAADFGSEGILETLSHLEAARGHGLKAHAGLGVGRERYRADVFPIGDVVIGIAAIGKGVNPSGPDGPGQPLHARPSDFEKVGLSLLGSKAHIRVLSVHYGEELSNHVSEEDRAHFRSALDRGRATIVFGHHSHVVAGVERRSNGLIFYGLGNFLHAGLQNMARYDQCRDFGLYARVYLWAEPGKDLVLRAVDVTPLMDMHEVPRPLPAGEASRRIEILNALSAELGSEGGQPLQFAATESGSGLACIQGSARYGDELEERCQEIESRPVMTAALARHSSSICVPMLEEHKPSARGLSPSK
jgi:hypothetical protein